MIHVVLFGKYCIPQFWNLHQQAMMVLKLFNCFTVRLHTVTFYRCWKFLSSLSIEHCIYLLLNFPFLFLLFLKHLKINNTCIYIVIWTVIWFKPKKNSFFFLLTDVHWDKITKDLILNRPGSWIKFNKNFTNEDLLS